MPATALFFLVGCVAISALPPLNGFASEWLIFQAILQSPELPQWGLKIVVPGGRRAARARPRRSPPPASSRPLALRFSAGRARPAATNAREVDRFSPAAMAILAALCLIAGVLPGLVHRLALAGNAGAAGRRHAGPGERCPGSRIVPIAESRSSYNGLLVFLFIGRLGSIAVLAIHASRRTRMRRAPAWDCGFPDPSPTRNTSADSFAQPIRRVFGTLLFRAAGAG